MLVRGADVERLVALGALETGVDIGGQHRAGQIAEMLDAVDIRQGGGDEDTGHDAVPMLEAGGRVEVEVPFELGVHVTVVQKSRNGTFEDLLSASESTLSFWDNSYDDEDWNCA